MASRLNPYLNFNGSARQALDFYRSVFGGNLTLSTFAEFGMTDAPDADKIMHGQLETDAGYTIMAADVPSHMEYQAPAGFSVSLSGDVRVEAEASVWVRRRAPRRLRSDRRPVRRERPGRFGAARR